LLGSTLHVNQKNDEEDGNLKELFTVFDVRSQKERNVRIDREWNTFGLCAIRRKRNRFPSYFAKSSETRSSFHRDILKRPEELVLKY
jgi:hypothetical protein